MRVYQVNCTARFSTGKLAEAIHNELIRQGNQARLAYGNGGEEKENFYHIGSLTVQRLDGKFQQITGTGSPLTLPDTEKLIRDIETFHPDIIHLHNLHGNYLHLKRFLGYLHKKQIPVVVTLHDCWFLTGGCMHFTMNGCCGWQGTCQACPHTYPYLLRNLYSLTGKNLSDKKNWMEKIDNLTVVTVSEWLKGIALQSHLKKRNVQAIYNGIDTQVFCPKEVSSLRKEYGCEGKVVLLGVASSWGQHKGLAEWFNLAKQLDSKYTVMLVGLQKHQIPANAPANVIALGRTESDRELADYYNMADIFINMSYEETFGLTTAEALACGKPVIVMDATANPELVTKDTGIVVPNRETQTLQQAIETIEEKGLDSYTSACVTRARTCFDQQVMARRYIEAYAEILRQKSTEKETDCARANSEKTE